MTVLQRGKKIEITKQLTSESATTISQWIGCYCVVWNCKMEEFIANNEEYKRAIAAGESATRTKLNQKAAHFINEERAYLADIPSQIRRNAATKFNEAVKAFIRGIRKPPRFKNKYSKRNCLVTNELFDVKFTDTDIIFSIKKSNKSKAFCQIVTPIPDKSIGIPKMLYLSRKGARFWFSWSYNIQAKDLRSESQIIEELAAMPKDEQEQMVVGLDLGVIQPLMLSTGLSFDYSEAEKKSLNKKERNKKRYQKKLSRQLMAAKKNKRAVGANYAKTRAKSAKQQANMANLRHTAAHRWTKHVAHEVPLVLVCEKLKIKNMTKRPKAKQDPETKRWLVNGASRKAGLNKKILGVSWGRVQTFLEYKLREMDKCMIKIAPNYSSQECSICGHIAKENRKTQAQFCCVSCGHAANADQQAAQVLKKRLLMELNKGKFVLPTKRVKKISVRKKTAKIAGLVCGAKVRPTKEGVRGETESFVE
jgi:putative transposase